MDTWLGTSYHTILKQLEFYIMATVNLYGVDVPETIQTKMAQTIASSEKNEKAWQVLGQDMLKLGLTAEMIRRPYGEDKQSHKQLSALIIAGLPASMQTAMAKPPTARSAKDKELAENGQKRVGVYRVRLANYMGSDNTSKSGAQQAKTTGHKVSGYLSSAINALQAEDLSGIPNGYRLSERIQALKLEYKYIAGQVFKDKDDSK
jgi:hypothetical protein